MACPQLFIGYKFYLAPFSDCAMDEPLKVSNEGDCLNWFRVQLLPAGKGEQLRDQACAPVGGLPRRERELLDADLIAALLSISSRFPEITISKLLKSWATPPVS